MKRPIPRWTSVGAVAASGALFMQCAGREPAVEQASAQAEGVSAKYDWLQFDGDALHSGNNALETSLSASNVAHLTQLFKVKLPARADGAAAVVANVATSSGTRDLVFLNTVAGHVVALDALTGATVWSHQNGAGSCRINGSGGACYTTSSPAVDPSRAFVYAYGLDGRVHKYAIADGAEMTSGGWPETTTLKGFDEKSSTPVTIASAKSGHTYLYQGNGGYPGDRGDYQGHVTAIDLASGAQNVFNMLCSNQTAHFAEKPGTPDCASVQGAVWARSGVVYDTATDRLYAATGNGNYNGTTDWGDSVVALHPDGSGTGGGPVDAYTPTNFQQLDSSDEDVGSTAPAILPSISGSGVAHVGVQSGKDAKLRLLNLDNLSGKGGPGHTGGELQILAVPQGGEVLTAIAIWVDAGVPWIFVANDNGIAALRATASAAGAPTLTKVWQSTPGGTSPLVANGVLYYATNGAVRALNPATGALLWSGAIGSVHWESPVIANGTLYITDESGSLTVFSVPAASRDAGAPDATIGSDICATIAERTTQTIKCPAGGTFKQVVFASYGTPTGACGTFKASGCAATASVADVASACVGKGSCTLNASNSVFGDPCSGTKKHLDVELSCR
jgi:outer membrane protein assembly factor BamB